MIDHLPGDADRPMHLAHVRTTLWLTGMLWATGPLAAWGQALSVQQLSFSQFSVGTTVSVPDRGQALLGGVSSGAAGRTRLGWGPGSNRGAAWQGSSVSVRAVIHDFAEMDRQALESARGVSADPRLSVQAEAAFETLQRRGRRVALPESFEGRGLFAQQLPAPSVTSAGDGTQAALDHSSSRELAEKYQRQGERAEQEGRPELAKVYFRLARKHGPSHRE